MKRTLILTTLLSMLGATYLSAEPVNSRKAMRILPKAIGPVALTQYRERLPQKDIDQLSAANLKLDDVFTAVGASLSGYGAVAISPDEGLLVEWISGVSEHHSPQAARAGALNYCNSQKKTNSAECVVLLEVAPKGVDPDAALTLSDAANAALRDGYKSLKKPKAFAVSPSTGDFGYEAGDTSRALEACRSAVNKAEDCHIVIVD
ncbi:MAG: hypothetical protein ABJ327_09745 [Litoreibacter sp.]